MTNNHLFEEILAIKTKADANFERDIPEPFVPRRNYAGVIGDPCLRYLVLNRIHGSRKKVDPGLQRIFARGQWLERYIISELSHSGIEVLEYQFPFEFKDLNLSGKGDFQINVSGSPIPIEAKVISYSDRIKSVDDFIWSDRRYHLRYPTQLNIAMRAIEAEAGAFLIFDPGSFDWRLLPMEFSWEMWERTVVSCREIERHLHLKTLPDPIDYREDWCGECDFLDRCYPDHPLDNATRIDDPELGAMLDRRQELKELVNEYAQIDKYLKECLPAGEGSTLIGHWEVIAKECYRKEYTVAASNYLRRQFRDLVATIRK